MSVVTESQCSWKVVCFRRSAWVTAISVLCAHTASVWCKLTHKENSAATKVWQERTPVSFTVLLYGFHGTETECFFKLNRFASPQRIPKEAFNRNKLSRITYWRALLQCSSGECFTLEWTTQQTVRRARQLWICTTHRTVDPSGWTGWMERCWQVREDWPQQRRRQAVVVPAPCRCLVTTGGFRGSPLGQTLPSIWIWTPHPHTITTTSTIRTTSTVTTTHCQHVTRYKQTSFHKISVHVNWVGLECVSAVCQNTTENAGGRVDLQCVNDRPRNNDSQISGDGVASAINLLSKLDVTCPCSVFDLCGRKSRKNKRQVGIVKLGSTKIVGIVSLNAQNYLCLQKVSKAQWFTRKPDTSRHERDTEPCCKDWKRKRERKYGLPNFRNSQTSFVCT